MNKLSDIQLIESYFQALDLKLNHHFIQLLKAEIYRRSILKINIAS